ISFRGEFAFFDRAAAVRMNATDRRRSILSGILTKPDRTLAGPPAPPLPRLENGEHLDQKTFHARYAAMPKSVKAELIGGRVYIMASPLHPLHGQHHSRLMGWLEVYLASTLGTNVFDNTSAILGKDSEPQPDGCLLIRPEFGGQTRFDEEGWLIG